MGYAPDSVALAPDFDGVAAGAEFTTYAADLVASMEPDDPGMHRTNTVDFGIVLDGEIVLEIDDGNETLLRAGETFVQLGARHAWRNRSDTTAFVAFVLSAPASREQR
ncbi:cupin domain-containing protein [Rhodococcus sp. T2V]|uniref:cupin domain-containing protein n=1 Tax=Rhodococcus sp. T2V TaxID=3034164 RepID=UPI0023E0B792|nr:cupin domain-containing protein [Rhodococcus sp. T2V]